MSESTATNDVAAQALDDKKKPGAFRVSTLSTCPCPSEFEKKAKSKSCRVFASKEIRLLYKGAPTLQKQ